MERKSQRRTLPYTFARISAMRSKLIARSEYMKLLKMDLNSITRFLQESEYKDPITKLSTKYEGIELVDHALKRSLVTTFDKLRMISPESVVEIIDLYLGRWDFQNLKVVLRGLYSNAEQEEVMALIEAVGYYGKDHFKKLFETGSVWDALKKSKIVSEKEIKKAYEEFEKSNRLIELENTLDHMSFQKAVDGAELCPEYGIVFKQFLLRDIDIVNIRNLLRYKREGLDPQTIMEYMIVQGQRLNKKTLEKLSKTDSVETLLGRLKKTYYGKFIDFSDKKTLVDIELELQNFNLKNGSLTSHQNPMSISSVISFMMSKMLEIKNLRSIVKSKHLGIEEDFVEKKLLVI